MLAVTGATGQLGRLVVAALLEKQPAQEIVAIVRDPAKAADLSAKGVQVRQADYAEPATLASALQGVSKLLLISASEMGKRAAQHQNVIGAAKSAGVGFVAYTSILHGDRSKLQLAQEHVATEKALADSGLPHALLRNGWYLENYTAQIPMALEHGFAGCAGNGRIAAAARADYAAAAVAVLTSTDQAGKSYELAGDEPFTMTELAAEVARQTGKPVAYADLPPEQFRAVLLGAGLPAPYADVLVDADLNITRGELDDRSGDLRRLIGRPTTTLHAAIAAALR
jgi:NAD(P)H dehydrogenase (quinone)